MASLAESAVTSIIETVVGGTSGRKFKLRQVQVALTGQGGASNKVLASAFGLTGVVAVLSCVVSDNTRYIATPSYDGTYIQLMDPISGSNAGADVTATVRMLVLGWN